MDRRQFLGRSLGGLAATGTRAVPAGAGPRRPVEGDRGAGGETLYNGIRLPAAWPPRLGDVPRDPVDPAVPAVRRRPSSPSTSAGNSSSMTSSSRRRPSRARYHRGEVPRREPRPEARTLGAEGGPSGDGLQRRRLVRPAGPALQDVVHGRPRRAHLLRHLEGRRRLGEARRST